MQVATTLSLSVLLASGLSAQIKTSAVPRECNGLEGWSWHFKPYDDSNMRYMHHFGAAHMPIAKGKAILGVSFRHEGRHSRTYVKKVLQWEIFLGGTSNSSKAMSTTFLKNYNLKSAPRVSVFKGKINLPVASVGPTTGLGGPIFMQRLSRPYIYPGGNFLIEIIARDSTAKNVSIKYTADRIYGGSSSTTLYGYLGQPCPVNRNALSMTMSNVRPGGSLVTRLSNASVTSGVGLMVLGTSIDRFGPLQLPFDLKPLGAAGCMLHTDILIAVPATITNGTSLTNLSIPQYQTLGGVVINTQFMIFDKAANKLGISFSLLGQRMVSKTQSGSYPLDCSYMYWVGAGNPYSRGNAPMNWTNRADVMVIQHN